jgi:hypothetical protein
MEIIEKEKKNTSGPVFYELNYQKSSSILSKSNPVHTRTLFSSILGCMLFFNLFFKNIFYLKKYINVNLKKNAIQLYFQNGTLIYN